MKPNDPTDVGRYVDTLAHAFPVFTAEEQRAAVTLYRQLAKGHPVALEQFAAALNAPAAKARELLERAPIKGLVYSDQHGSVVGFGGLAAVPMHHKFTVNGQALWTWCAWDSLFIPEILGATAQIESPDPETGDIVRLEVSPNGITVVEPDTAVISFLLPDSSTFAESASNAMTKFCHFVFFFASRESGDRWVGKHPGTFLYSLDDAVTIARRLNARKFGFELKRLASQTK